MSPKPDGAQILVVEDEPDIMELVRLTLHAAGHRTAPAPDGITALKAVQASPPDLVVLDLGLPGMEGIEVLRRLRLANATRTVPVLVLTARLDAGSESDVLDAGATEFMVKPFKRQELVAAVERLLSANAPAPRRKRLGLF